MLSEQSVSTLVMLTDVSRPGGLRSQQSSGDSAKESGSPQTESDQVRYSNRVKVLLEGTTCIVNDTKNWKRHASLSDCTAQR